ncbi:uncharacterized protein LOC129893427 isoform X2 [Solanum dulcamara]|uniref:uncharacterized protein LOC129893427 isoform X2 n=1 Tax=Solanum dulcamara TaxID=45834 RepID=UPI002485CAE0|nr:uncharacterized protein LOC129893427 isoform X2 [Solanum dulcamara]
MLAKKRLSSKINYDVLEKLFDDSATENPKKAGTAYDSMDDNGVKSDKIDPEVDETYEEAFGKDVHYGEMLEDMAMINTMIWMIIELICISYGWFPLRNRGYKMSANTFSFTCIRNCMALIANCISKLFCFKYH